jgi:hypothetical protein
MKNLNLFRFLVLSAAFSMLVMGSQSASAMTRLEDKELARVYGAGSITLYQDVARTMDPQHSKEIADKIVYVQKGLLSQILDWDETVEGKMDRSVTTVETVGDEIHITTQVDEYIARVTLANIRVKGTAPTGPSFGSITINDISIQGSISTVYRH